MANHTKMNATITGSNVGQYFSDSPPAAPHTAAHSSPLYRRIQIEAPVIDVDRVDLRFPGATQAPSDDEDMED
jgi:hypothetical protein